MWLIPLIFSFHDVITISLYHRFIVRDHKTSILVSTIMIQFTYTNGEEEKFNVG